ncbi:CaiB/BaiF CoA transferase family protein [Hoeflea sp. TYP-13]|uniref:CaiB/BaiF CoA transferase family protein n=1 Tax=Hoeflea sp. TYP-13 TaxID=3230023 RepID=UPI0034C5D8BA
MSKPLNGLKLVEMAGLGPAPFACYLLAGLGAEVTRIEAKGRSAVFLPLDPQTNPDVLYRNICELDLKSDEDRNAALALIQEADVLVEGFRPGVMERLGLGPDEMLQANPRLIYARMTGYGQSGPMSDRAGHDLNYISMSGVLSMIGRKDSGPVPPLNLVGDYGGGTMVLIMGILSALYAREQTGKGQVIDTSMVEGSAMLATPIFSFMASGMWRGGERGQNLLDTGCPFYDTYETADGRHVAVAPLEPQFFAALIEGLDLDRGWTQKQYDRECWDELRDLLKATFLTKSRDEWAAVFAASDACVTPVLTPQEAAIHKHNTARQSFDTVAGHIMPGLAPKFS